MQRTGGPPNVGLVEQLVEEQMTCLGILQSDLQAYVGTLRELWT